jgi:hypothetical protein
VYVVGLVHGANAEPSSWHSNRLPLSVDVNANACVVEFAPPVSGGEVIVVFGRGVVEGETCARASRRCRRRQVARSFATYEPVAGNDVPGNPSDHEPAEDDHRS